MSARGKAGSKLNRAKLEKVKLPEEHRLKIANSNILSRLIRCAEGTETMDSVQASVAIALMRKVLPDLASAELAVTTQQPFAVLPDVIASETAWEATHSPEAPKPVSDTTKH